MRTYSNFNQNDLLDYNLSKSKDVRLFIVYIICLVLGIINSINDNTIIGIAATLLICCCVFLFDMERVFLLIMGTQFLVNVIPFSIGGSRLGFVFFAFLCVVLKIFMQGRKSPIEVLWVALLMMLDILSSIISNDLETAVTINWSLSLLFMIYVLYKYADKIDLNKLIIFLCLAEWSIIIINVIAENKLYGMSLQPSMYGYIRTEEGTLTFGSAYAAVAGGNAIAMNNSLCIALCFLSFKQTQSFVQKVFYIITIIGFLFTGFMIISRAFYIEIILLIVLVVFSNYKKPMHFVLTLFIIAGVLFAIVYYFKTVQTDVFNLVQLRFNKGNEDRTLLWSNAIIILSNNPRILFFGAGSNYPIIYINATAHNIFIDSILSLGVIGSIIYWALIIKATAKSIFIHRNNEKSGLNRANLSNYIPLIMLIVFRLISGSVRDVFFYFLISVVVIFAIQYNKQS